MIYMDNAATTKIHPEVVNAMLPYLGAKFANPSGIYTFAKGVRKDVERARYIIASTIGSMPEEIYFTSGGTEADNWALKAAAREHDGGNVISTQVEHKAILESLNDLENNGIRTTKMPVDKYGMIELDRLQKTLRSDTFLISVMAANNEIGTIMPFAQIGRIARSRKILFHTDAVQAYTNIPINVNSMNIDMLSVSAHKIRGPKGVGFLYIRKGCVRTSFINGGSQEMGMRAGTENVAGIIGLAKAAEIAYNNMKARTNNEIRKRDYMIDKILTNIDGVTLNGHRSKRLPNNANFTIKGVNGASMVLMLDQQGICASAGSACTSASAKPSHVLKAIGMSDDDARSTLRLTINEEITYQDIDYVVRCIKSNVERARREM